MIARWGIDDGPNPTSQLEAAMSCIGQDRWLRSPVRRPRASLLRDSVLRTGATLALAAALTSCGSYRMVAPADPTLAQKTARADRVFVSGYTTTDAQYHEFHGYLTVRGDSLILTRPSTPKSGVIAGSPELVVALPRDEVYSLKLSDGISIPRTVLLGLSLLVASLYAYLSGNPI